MDCRDIAREKNKMWDVNESRKVMSLTDDMADRLREWADDDSESMFQDVESFEFPFKFEVCPTCEGKGKHVHPDIDRNGLSSEDFDRDPDFQDDYMSGRYDVQCYECHGNRVVPEVDEDRLNEQQKVWFACLQLFLEEEAAYAYARAKEIQMGY